MLKKTPTSRYRTRIALAPVVLICGTLVAGVGASSPIATADSPHVGATRGLQIPAEVVTVPATVPNPGLVAPSVVSGSEDSAVSSASVSGIPAPALTAYQRGAQIIDSADAGCNLPWELLAAIGRVESDHGRSGGNVLAADGVAEPGIYGVTLNGRNNTRTVADTDAGEVDGNRFFDRAVGPMQFLPSTWSVVKVDADGDGKRDPQDINDAALAAAVYLCSGSGDLATREGQQAAVYRYDHSRAYVNLVLRLVDAYSVGDYSSIPSGVYAGGLFDRSSLAAARKKHHINASSHQAAGSKGTAPSATPVAAEPGGGSGAEPSNGAPTKQISVAGIRSVVTNLLHGPADGPPATLPAVASRLEATTECLRSGVRKLDVSGLARCIDKLLGEPDP
ncbi:MAG: hypothetical protein JWP74_2004 [Marmoricola sp.]|nr:hypothetical protein [Marmoricola sp.]